MSITNNNISILCCCPITGEYMKDPVITPDGNTYERKAIEEWLLKNETDPITNNKLTHNQLISNRALKGLYENIIVAQQNVSLVQIVNKALKILYVNIVPQQTISFVHFLFVFFVFVCMNFVIFVFFLFMYVHFINWWCHFSF